MMHSETLETNKIYLEIRKETMLDDYRSYRG